MALVNLNSSFTLDYTFLSNEFIDNYMLDANPTFSLIYIYVLRICSSNNQTLNTEDISKNFNVLESDVINAFEYWKELKLIEISNAGDDININFLQVPSKKIDPIEEIETKEFNYSPTKPDYSPQELEIYQNESPEIKLIFKAAERNLGKLLTNNDLKTLFGFYDWLRLPADVIIKLLEYCSSIGQRRLNYVEAVAVDWAENNIDSVEKADEYIGRFKNKYMVILKSFGITGRIPAKVEIDFMKKWLDEYKFPIEIIIEACNKTILLISKASFSYTDGILINWQKEGVNTLEDARKSDIEFKEKKSAKIKKQTTKPGKPSKIVNYTGRNWDYDKLEKLEQRLLEQ